MKAQETLFNVKTTELELHNVEIGKLQNALEEANDKFEKMTNMKNSFSPAFCVN